MKPRKAQGQTGCRGPAVRNVGAHQPTRTSLPPADRRRPVARPQNTAANRPLHIQAAQLTNYVARWVVVDTYLDRRYRKFRRRIEAMAKTDRGLLVLIGKWDRINRRRYCDGAVSRDDSRYRSSFGVSRKKRTNTARLDLLIAGLRKQSPRGGSCQVGQRIWCVRSRFPESAISISPSVSSFLSKERRMKSRKEQYRNNVRLGVTVMVPILYMAEKASNSKYRKKLL